MTSFQPLTYRLILLQTHKRLILLIDGQCLTIVLVFNPMCLLTYPFVLLCVFVRTAYCLGAVPNKIYTLDVYLYCFLYIFGAIEIRNFGCWVKHHSTLTNHAADIHRQQSPLRSACDTAIHFGVCIFSASVSPRSQACHTTSSLMPPIVSLLTPAKHTSDILLPFHILHQLSKPPRTDRFDNVWEFRLVLSRLLSEKSSRIRVGSLSQSCEQC
jgi:hypothetical protein